MKPFINQAGYLRISLSNDSQKRQKFYLQRLVAYEFIDNPENKPTVNHINNNILDNRVCNLEWSTMSEQNKHKYKTNSSFDKPINVKSIWRLDCKTLEKLEKYKSTTDAAKWININNLTNCKNFLNCRQALNSVANGKHASAYGYKWIYEQDIHSDVKNEIWKDISHIVGFKNYYISDYGRIKNNKGEICKLKPHSNGYIKTTINKKSYSLHRLVAIAFLPNLQNKEFVNHIDGNKCNNKLSNLEWSTCLENNIHKINFGISNTTKRVIQYDKNMNKINEFISITEASKQVKLSKCSISNCCNGRTKSTKKDNYIFKFA
jgi:hypothetical protein